MDDEAEQGHHDGDREGAYEEVGLAFHEEGNTEIGAQHQEFANGEIEYRGRLLDKDKPEGYYGIDGSERQPANDQLQIDA